MQNGHTRSEPNGQLGDVAKANGFTGFTGKRPTSWSTALELCRKAHMWTQKQLIAEALQGENVSTADVKRWELARSHPTLNQCHKLRAAMPELFAFDDLLPLGLRSDPGKKTKVLAPPVKPEGWPGPPVSYFGEALDWALKKHWISRGDFAKMVGMINVAGWFKQGYIMIRGTWDRVCQVLPEMVFAPQPPFSNRFQNQRMGRGFLEGQELHKETARAARAVDMTPPGPPVAATLPATQPPTHAPLNTAGVNYGVLKATVMGLEAQRAALDRKYEKDCEALDMEIKHAVERVEEADKRMRAEAMSLHGGHP